MDYKNRVFWNNNSYGKAIKINKKLLQTIFIFLCITTPGTNWLIPFFINKIKPIIWRY
jgi:hypothetical protein